MMNLLLLAVFIYKIPCFATLIHHIGHANLSGKALLLFGSYCHSKEQSPLEHRYHPAQACCVRWEDSLPTDPVLN